MRMYSEYFGIRENAFAITPDPRYLFMSDHHREAMAHLLFGMEEGGGFVQLTGEVGTGKTTISRAFLEQLPENVDVALLLNPPDNGRELLLAIVSELRLPLPRRNAGVRELVELLNERLLGAHAGGRRTVVIIDEAQNISPDVLEQVRLLTNLETSSHKLLQVFLIGQPELRQKLEQPALRQVAQRITARYHLEPLSLFQTQGYIHHRLEVAGCRQGLFSPAAIKQIYLQSQGIPRVINILCDRALLGAFATDSSQVSASIVRYAAREWRGENGRGRPVPPLARTAIAVAVAGLTFAAAVGFAGNGSTHPAENIASLAKSGAITIGNLVKHGHSLLSNTSTELISPVENGAGVSGKAAVAAPEPDVSTMSSPLSETVSPVKLESFTSAVTGDEVVSEPSVASTEAETVSAQHAVQAGMPIALQALLASWDIRSDSLDRTGLCDKVVSDGLLCLRTNGDWDDLRAYNRPALLTLNRQTGRDAYLALVGMNREHALVATVDGPRQVSYRELDAFWTGEFVLLWRPPLEGVSLIGAGSADWAIEWLRKALAQIDGHDTPAAVASARDMERRLRSFQSSHGLYADGVAGPRTLIHLNTLISERKFPVLVPAHRNS